MFSIPAFLYFWCLIWSDNVYLQWCCYEAAGWTAVTSASRTERQRSAPAPPTSATPPAGQWEWQDWPCYCSVQQSQSSCDPSSSSSSSTRLRPSDNVTRKIVEAEAGEMFLNCNIFAHLSPPLSPHWDWIPLSPAGQRLENICLEYTAVQYRCHHGGDLTPLPLTAGQLTLCCSLQPGPSNSGI